uniref:Uncharacterized protein n=1 Tax=Arundo donax TaxID=35708 RepID=A0A0A9CQ50_ARUDO
MPAPRSSSSPPSSSTRLPRLFAARSTSHSRLLTADAAAAAAAASSSSLFLPIHISLSLSSPLFLSSSSSNSSSLLPKRCGLKRGRTSSHQRSAHTPPTNSHSPASELAANAAAATPDQVGHWIPPLSPPVGRLISDFCGIFCGSFCDPWAPKSRPIGNNGAEQLGSG